MPSRAPTVPETRSGVQMIRSEASIEPTFCCEFEAAELGIEPNQAVFSLTTISYDRNENPIAFGRTIFSTDRSRIAFDMKHDQPMPGWA